MSRKKRVLIVTEFSQFATGFSTIARYLMPRLFQSNKYELAEMAVYVNRFHPLMAKVPWKVYANEPDPGNEEQAKLYQSNRLNQFGRWRFNEVCQNFRPDIVINWSDVWMQQFINESAYRSHFKYIHMTTCDGEPQKPEWIEDYGRADILHTYSSWAKGVIERQSGGTIKVRHVTPACPDIEVFKPPADKAALRGSLGLEANLFIVQTVMRNQPRKLFPDLMRAFSRYLDLCRKNGKDELAAKSYLYLHTTWPDVGWNLPEEIRRHRLSHKVLVSYLCPTCGHVSPCFYSGENPVCWTCKKGQRKLPHTNSGASREDLAKIMGIADVYIQYSICEGQGMPINDAKACGVPVMCIDYSAMAEQNRNGGGIPLPVGHMFQEPLNQTEQLRAYPDNQATAEILYEFATNSQEYRDQLGREARKCVEEKYNWDKIAADWMESIDSLVVPDQEMTWLSPPRQFNIPPALPQQVTQIPTPQFVAWCYQHLAGRPDMIGSTEFTKIVNILNQGFEPIVDEKGNPAQMRVDRNIVFNNMANIGRQTNALEQMRYQRLVLKSHERPQQSFMVQEV